MTYKRVILAALLGVGALGVAVIADGVMGASKGPSPLATFVIMGVYLAACQAAMAIKGVERGDNLAILIAMAVPPLLIFAITFVAEPKEVVMNQGVPGLVASCLGPLVGVCIARLFKTKRQ